MRDVIVQFMDGKQYQFNDVVDCFSNYEMLTLLHSDGDERDIPLRHIRSFYIYNKKKKDKLDYMIEDCLKEMKRE